jgi:flagellin-like protein
LGLGLLQFKKKKKKSLKKMKNFIQFRLKNEKAVSAVIGVILMVAITVALAATIYVYVSGMFGGIKGDTASVTCITDSSTNRIIITSASGDLKWNDIIVITDNTSVNWRVYDSSKNPLDVEKSTSGVTNNIAAGDYIEFDFTANPGMSGNVRVSLRFSPTNSLLGSWTITV